MDFSFVILHYNVLNETLSCVKSIRERVQEPVGIVVVDNASPNGSGKNLEQIFKDDENVTVLLNKENLGFANGNNVGISFARKKLKSNFVVVLNNDTFLIQNDFLKVIRDEWGESRFAVMGPKVFTYSGRNQNPVANKIENKKQANYWIRHHFWGLVRTYLGVDDFWLECKAVVKKRIKYRNEMMEKKEAQDNIRQENVKLHGCCFVFSPAFFDHFDGFDPRTFMYVEEDILYNHV